MDKHDLARKAHNAYYNINDDSFSSRNLFEQASWRNVVNAVLDAVYMPDVDMDIARKFYNMHYEEHDFDNHDACFQEFYRKKLEKMRDIMFADVPRWVPLPKGGTIKAGQRHMYKYGSGETHIYPEGTTHYDHRPSIGGYFIDSRDIDPRIAILTEAGVANVQDVINKLDNI